MIRSICTAFVNAPLFRRRTPEAQLLWFKLYTHPAQHLCGLFVLDLGGMAHCTGLDMGRTGAAFGELLQTGLCEADNSQDLVWVPEMSNQCKAMTKAKGTVYTAVDKYIHSLGRSALCLRVCDTLGIPYHYPIDTLLSGSVLGIGSGSGTGGQSPLFAGGSSPARPVVETGQTSEPLESPRTPAPVQGSRPAQDGLPGLALATPETGPKRAPKARKEPSATSATWDAYSSAYAQRYGSPPVRNAKVNGQLARLVEQLGADEAPPVAAFYLTHPAAIYNFHPVGLLLRDCQALRTQWMRGSVVTPTAARRNEETAANPALALLLEQRRKKQGDG